MSQQEKEARENLKKWSDLLERAHYSGDERTAEWAASKIKEIEERM